MSIIFWYGVNHFHGQSTLLQAILTKRRNFTRFHSSASKPPVKVSVSSWIQFLFQIEDDLDKTTIDRMNEYGSVDAVKESFDLLQQRVSEAFTCYWHSTSTNEAISSVDFQRWKRLEYLTNPRVSFTSKERKSTSSLYIQSFTLTMLPEFSALRSPSLSELSSLILSTRKREEVGEMSTPGQCQTDPFSSA